MNGPGRRRARWRAVAPVAGLFLLSAAAAAYEIAPASVIPLVRASLGIDPAAAGWLVSVMYLTAFLSSIPLGAVLDRIPVRGAVTTAGLALLVAGAWGWTAAVSGDYGSLLASRVLGGLAYVFIWNAGANLAGQVVSPDARATAVGVFTASAPAGFVLGQFGSPLLAAAASWPVILPGFAALAVVGVAVFLASTRGAPLTIETPSPDRAGFRRLFSDPAVWTLSLLCALAFSLYLFLNSWFPSYLTQEVGLSLAAGGLLTAVFPAVGIASRISSGVLSDRLFGGRRRPVTLLSFAVAAPTVAGFVLVESRTALVALVVVAGFAVQLAIGVLFTHVAEVVADEVRTTAIAVLTSAGMLGATAAPIGAGVLIDAAGYQPAFLAAAAVALVGVLAAWRAPEGRRGD